MDKLKTLMKTGNITMAVVRKLAVKNKPLASTVKARPRPGTAPTSASVKPRPGASVRTTAGTSTGMAGFEKAREITEQQDREYEKKRNTPFRFRLKKGESAELVMLDNEPFFVREHTWKSGPNKFTTEVCIADTGENCPLCSMLGKEGSYTLMCSAADKRPYTTKDKKLVKISKKLVPVKAKNIAKFERLWKKYGSLRGVVLKFSRDGDKEASIGEDIQDLNRKVPLPKLKAMGEVTVIPNYKEIFALPSADELRRRHRLDAPIGSEDFGGGGRGGSQEAVDDEIPW